MGITKPVGQRTDGLAGNLVGKWADRRTGGHAGREIADLSVSRVAREAESGEIAESKGVCGAREAETRGDIADLRVWRGAREAE